MKKGKNTYCIRENTLIGFKNLVEMFEGKKVNKDKTINFTMKDINTKLSVIALDILTQIDEEKMFRLSDKFYAQRKKQKKGGRINA